MKRSSGVLMHISSLFGRFSIGAFSDSARYFIDFLKDAGFSFWQVLPFGMTDEYNSPYKSYSSFAANPYFIDLERLYYDGLLTNEELSAAVQNSPYLAEYERLSSERLSLLRLAASRVLDRDKVIDFINENPCLLSATRFLALRDANGGTPWHTWTVAEPDPEELFFWQFVQYEFFTEWREIKAYANERGIKIIGDMPIYVALDSSDVWENPEEFLLDEDNIPTAVAGVPPDYFSSEGQLWHNPLYDYEKMRKGGYTLWRRRVSFMLKLFDGIRIDHFRGIESFWSVPYGETSAKRGKWIKGPGKELIDVIRETAGDKLVIAEDLGEITEQVRALLDYSGFPGMRVFQFGFLTDGDSIHRPHNYEKNTVAYTGTHDNNTLLGFIWEEKEEVRRKILEYAGAQNDEWSDACRKIVKCVMASHADTVIFPVQDLLVFGNDTRMNTPGSAENNWKYRITKSQLDAIDREEFYRMNALYGRI